MPFSDMLRNRGFQIAITCSLTWHAFWLFAVTATFATPERARKPTRIYFLGPVLSDDSFNMLVATKPELSKTRYLASEDSAAESLEPPLESLGRQSPGDLVSVPSGGTTWNLLRGVLGTGETGSVPLFAEKFNVDIGKSPFPVSGALAKRGLINAPPPPLSLAAPGDEEGVLLDAVFELTVDAKGDVARVDIVSSSGDPGRDMVWQNYLKKWQFYPLDDFSTADQKGQIRIRPQHGEERP